MTNSAKTVPTAYRTRRRLFHVMLAALALLLTGHVAPAGAEPAIDQRAPDLGECQQLHVSAEENQVAAYLFGVGVQIYQWDGATWKFVNPMATLYADAGHHSAVCSHFGGPTWQSNSGSKVVGKVDDFCTPDPTAIPWLLLHAASSEGPGIFDGVTFIQRVNTVGGLAPADPGAFVGEIAQVPYTADYVFYRHRGVDAE